MQLILLILGLAFSVGVPGYFVLQPLAAIRMKGGWRIAALARLLLSTPAFALSIVALVHGSNLWPIHMVLFAPLGSLYLTALFFVHSACK